MKSLLEGLTNMDDKNKKMVRLFTFGFVAIIILIIIIAIIVAIVNKKTSYESMEEIMEKAAYEYFQNNLGQLPNAEVKTSVVSAQTLAEQKYMKSIEKYTKDSSCTGNVIVTYVNGDYDYQGYLTCNSFVTNLLVDKIKKDNQIVTTGAGLYEESGVLRFRGEYVNNYLKVDNQLYRIVKLDNNKIYLIANELDTNDDLYNPIWDDRYNLEEDSNCGINDYSLSRIRSSLDDIYKKIPKLLKNNLTTYNLCIGKRNETDIQNSGEIECSNIIENQYIGLLPTYEYIKASVASSCNSVNTKTCKNYNYLYIDEGWWTITASSLNTKHVYYVSGNGEIETDAPDYRKMARYVVVLKENTILKDGNGTKEKPYTIR